MPLPVSLPFNFLHVLRVFIGKTVLGENGVYLGVVFAGASEDVDHSAFGVLGFFRPFGYAHDCLVAAFAPFELVLRNEDVAGEELGVGFKECDGLVDLQRADEHLFLWLHDVDYLCFGFLPFAAGGDVDFHAVAVEGMHGVALRHEDGFVVIVGYDAVLAV